MDSELDTRDNYELTQDGVFDFIKISQINVLKGHAYTKFINERSLEEKPRAFIISIGVVNNCAGGGNGRVWISYEGNVTGIIAIPFHMFKSEICAEFFPVISTIAIAETCNKYAPGQYIKKFPNDTVCIEHGRKTGGSIIRKLGKFVLISFGLNLIKAPSDELLRKQGLKACCMKDHTKNVPTPDEFLKEAARTMLEYSNEKYDTIEKIIEVINKTHDKFPNKKFTVEINNRNADLKKDGVIWCNEFPNALIKGYLNGYEYSVSESFFDRIYYSIKGNADDKKSYEQLIEKYQKEDEQKKEEKKEV